MTSFKKAIIGSAAAAAMAVSFSPAQAQAQTHSRGGDGISAGEVIAGALIIGGIAAIASSSRNDRGYDYDRAGYRGDYRRGNHRAFRGQRNARQSVRQCVAAAERAGLNYGRFSNVIDVRDVDRTRDGFRVRGRIEVGNRRNSDRGRFTCRTEYGRVTYMDLDNVRPVGRRFRNNRRF